jgi:signal transduction histidine kinase/CheY-like chemotaxis protein
MFCDRPTLDQFAQAVPCCQQNAPLWDLISVFQSSRHQQIVILSPEEKPLGIINPRSLVNLLLRENQKNGEDWLDLLEPMVSLPGQMTIGEFKGNPFWRGQYSCGLVNEQGNFLGMLDFGSLLQFLVEQRIQASRSAGIIEQRSPRVVPGDSRESQSHDDNPLPPELARKFLFYLLEEFPLPVMLKTGQGETLYHNFLWRKQLGDSLSKEYLEKVEDFDSSAENQCPMWQLHQNILGSGLARDLGIECLHSCEKIATLEGKNNSPIDSHPVWELVRYSLNFPGICPHACFIFAKEVTERQRLTKELADKELDLLLLNRLRSGFLNYITHELKSPLTAIVGLSSLLREQKLGELNERQHRYAELIHNNGQKLITLLNDILDLTRIDTGDIKVNVVPIPPEKIVDFSEKYLALKNDKNVKFSLNIDPDLTEIEADDLRLNQMLNNLLDNAIKFTPNGGNMGLRVEQWQSWIALIVWDTGKGIPQDYQHLIFQKLPLLENSLHSSWHRELEGTGLSLALTQGLAKLHGGDISFISESGKGSEFTLLLPRHHKQKIEGNNNNNKLILIVETVVEYINSLTRILNKLGYKVVIARSGTEALEKAQCLQPKAIILNSILPLLSGWELLNRLKLDVSTQAIPTIVTGSETDRKKAEQYGANWFVNLPPDEEILCQILGGRRKELSASRGNITILCLHPEARQTGWVANMVNSLLEMGIEGRINYRIVQADDLQQAETIAKVWKIDVIIFDGTAKDISYIRSLSECGNLASLPLITLDAKTTEFANQFSHLKVFPCFVTPSEEGLVNLWEVVQIVLQNPQ